MNASAANVAEALGEHRFNDDLLLDDRTRWVALKQFASVKHLVDHEELRNVFRPLDQRAKRAKASSRTAGLFAIGLGTVALGTAAAAPAWSQLSGSLPSTIAIASAALGLAAVVVARGGVLHGRRKLEWIHTRFHTERLRQHHFQTYLFRLDDIADSCRSEDGMRRFIAARHDWLAQFESRYLGHSDSQLAEVLDPNVMPSVWVHERRRPSPRAPQGFDLSEVFASYRELRLLEQLGYGHHMLDTVRRGWNLWAQPLVVQKRWFAAVEWTALGGLVFVHVGIIIGHLLHLENADSSWTHIIALWLALVAIAVRTAAEALGISREIERYAEYRARVAELLQSFDSADAPGKLGVMAAMEEASYQEMRQFLRLQYESSFLF